jgi:hypothetical protein
VRSALHRWLGPVLLAGAGLLFGHVAAERAICL